VTFFFECPVSLNSSHSSSTLEVAEVCDKEVVRLGSMSGVLEQFPQQQRQLLEALGEVAWLEERRGQPRSSNAPSEMPQQALACFYRALKEPQESLHSAFIAP
jgi:hypothetical protein